MDDEKLVEELAAALGLTADCEHPHCKPCKDRRAYRERVSAILPIIAREVAAETERCARVAEGLAFWSVSATVVAENIRGHAINAAMDAEGAA